VRASADHGIVREVWFTADDLEEVLWLDRSQIERWLIEDGQILEEERGEHWAVDLPYMDRLVLTMIGRLPDHAEVPHDDATSLLLRYALVLVDKRGRFPRCDGELPSFEAVQRELEHWEDRVRPLLRRHTHSLRPAEAPMLASLVEVL
jgi:hypothetical protein